MKNLVVDSGISVKWFIEEDDSDIAQLIYDEYESGNLLFLAPDLIYAEFGNIIWKKLIFKNSTLKKQILLFKSLRKFHSL